MKVTFEIEYRTKWGESLALVLADKKYPMSWTDGSVWTLTLDKVSVAALKDYGYVLMKDGLIDRIEWTNHSTKPAAGTRELVIRDSWNDCPIPGCPFPRAHGGEEGGVEQITADEVEHEEHAEFQIRKVEQCRNQAVAL